MRQLLHRRPSPSLVVAIAAVVVAGTGSAVAATVITTKQIKNGTIELQDLSKATRDGLRGGRGPQGSPGAGGPQGPPGAAGPAAAAGRDGVPVVGLSTITNSTDVEGTAAVPLTGLTQSITVPAGQTRRVLATLSSESLCAGPADSYCSARIEVDGSELTPAVGKDFAFDSVDDGSYYAWEATSFQRYSGNLAAGVHSVTVVVENSQAGTKLTLDDAVLSVIQIAAA